LFSFMLDNEELAMDELTEDIMNLKIGEFLTQESTTILTST